MSRMLSKVTSNALPMPPRIVLYAAEKFGKTSWGAFAQKPIFLMTAGETGLLSLIEANRIPATPHFPEAKNWSDVCAAIGDLRDEDHSYKTLVIDTGNGAERLCAGGTCDDHFGGDWTAYDSYGRGNERTSKEWARFLLELELLRSDRKMQIIILQHAKVKTFQDPSTAKDWDQWRPEAIEKCWSLTHKWADCILFGGFKVTLNKDGKPTGEKRYLRTEASGAIVAGNRYGLPAELSSAAGASELWAAFSMALEKNKGKPQEANGFITAKQAADLKGSIAATGCSQAKVLASLGIQRWGQLRLSDLQAIAQRIGDKDSALLADAEPVAQPAHSLADIGQQEPVAAA